MLPSWLSLVDVVFLVVVGLFTAGGFQRGFAAQIAYVITFLFAGVLLFFGYPHLFGYLDRVFRGLADAYLMWIILATLVVLAIALYIMVSKLLAGLLKMQYSEQTDHIWGMVFGAARGILTGLAILIFIVMLEQSGKMYDTFSAKSVVGKLVCKDIVPRIQPRLAAMYESKIRVWQAELLKQEEAGNIGEM